MTGAQTINLKDILAGIAEARRRGRAEERDLFRDWPKMSEPEAPEGVSPAAIEELLRGIDEV